MKTNLILPAILLAFSSCSKYEINVLSSNNMKKDPETGKFSTENDSVKITYSFFGRNAPITLDVYNKLNEPVYIDWQRSAFITGDKAVSYASDQVHINGDISGATISNRSVSISSGNVDATAIFPKSIVFVPPHAHVNNKLLEVTDQNFEYYAGDEIKKQEIPSLSISGTSQAKVKEFTEDQSPMNFKSYLTLYTLDQNMPKYTAYQHSFFYIKTDRDYRRTAKLRVFYQPARRLFLHFKNHRFWQSGNRRSACNCGGGCGDFRSTAS